MPDHTIRVGPAGWSYKDWEGIVYPPHGSRFDPLAFLAGYFDTIEVNSSFYRVPPPAHALSWIRRVRSNGAFRFTVKLFRGFTHEAASSEDDAAAFRAFLDPLAEAGRLGAVLIQFPWSFRNSDESRERIASILGQFDEYPKAVEVRHASFQTPEFPAWLEQHGTSIVDIDQPLFSDSVRPAASAVGTLAYVRLHGRNYQKWFAHAESWERYDYLYSQKELEPWVDRIDRLSREREVFVITNNHFRGQAIINALDLELALGIPHEIPPTMVEIMKER